MKKRALLIVGLALLMAAAGVVYAHWTATLKVEAHVITGNVCIQWNYAFTDDDNGNTIGEEIGLPAPVFGLGSVDPSNWATVNPTGGLVTAATRYDKAIGNCASGVEQDGTMWVNIANVYPSYHCTIWAKFTNCGSVPVKVQSVENAISGGLTVPTDVTWNTVVGTGCGRQIDPGQSYTTVNQVHIEQAAPQNTWGHLIQKINFVNWNEWNSQQCGDLPLSGQ